MENPFGSVPIKPVKIEPSFFIENWPSFNNNSDVNFAVNSPLVPCILSSNNIKPTSVKKTCF